ncbi:MAG: hypothetical protein CSA84_03470 [Actinomycetales bacterium]|nr:MAG: hypothetical protein CSA84_03470 [Actinomycetales bacterium]
MSSTPADGFDLKAYEELAAARRRLVTLLVGITVVAYWTQQLLTNFTSVMDGEVVSGLSVAYLYAFCLFFLVVGLTTYYRRRIAQIEAAYRHIQDEVRS